MSDQKYLLGVTQSEANTLLFSRLKRSIEQLTTVYHDYSVDNPKGTAETLDKIITQVQGIKFEFELLGEKEILSNPNNKELQQ